MRKIHFLENDYECPKSDDVIKTAKRFLRYCKLPIDDIENMSIHYQFHLMKDDDVRNIIFDKSNILATYSMYVSGSDRQILSLLSTAGRNKVKDIIYIDASGQLCELLNDRLTKHESVYAIGCAINTNTILTYDFKSNSVKRLKFELKGYYDDCIELEDFEVSEIIKTETYGGNK